MTHDEQFRSDGFVYDSHGNQVGYHGSQKWKANGGNGFISLVIFAVLLYFCLKYIGTHWLKHPIGIRAMLSNSVNYIVDHLFWILAFFVVVVPCLKSLK